MNYRHKYLDVNTFVVIEVNELGETRHVDDTDNGYLAWVQAGNTPTKVSGNRFVTVTPQGTVIVDPNKEEIELAEQITFAKGRYSTRRWEKEQKSAIPVNGKSVSTSRENRANLLTLIMVLPEDNLTTAPYKFADGSFGDVTRADCISFVNAITSAVNEIFAAERNFFAAVDACQNKTELSGVIASHVV